MKVNITKIGNSKGVIIPAQILKACGFDDEVSMEVQDQSLVITKLGKPRAGWSDAIKEAGADDLLLSDFGNEFDADEWSW